MGIKLEEEKIRLQKELMETFNLNQNFSDEEILNRIEESVLQRSKKVYFSLNEKQQLKKELFHSFRA